MTNEDVATINNQDGVFHWLQESHIPNITQPGRVSTEESIRRWLPLDSQFNPRFDRLKKMNIRLSHIRDTQKCDNLLHQMEQQATNFI